MDQDIRFCVTADGARIAYATTGSGPPLIWLPWIVSHLELEWEDPARRAFLEELASQHTIVRYDRWGSGLSDRDRTDFSLDADVRPLETVADHLKLRRFVLFGGSAGGPPAIAYAATHPGRVSRLLLWGTFARRLPEERELSNAIDTLIRAHWGLGSQLLADRLMPGADSARLAQYTRFQREAVTADMYISFRGFEAQPDIRDICSRVRAPTLVLHRRGDQTIPFDRGREVAAAIPGARLLALEGELHPPWLGDSDFVLRAMSEFLGTATAAESPPRSQPETVTAERETAYGLVAGMESVTLSRYSVTTGYIRYAEAARQSLKDVRQAIAAGLETKGRKRENHLIWAPPGSGKTYFVQRIAASAAASAEYCELNLAACDRDQIVATLRRLESAGACLCFVDEVDARPEEAWPYEVLLPALDANATRGSGLVFVLAGSSGASLAEMKDKIAARPKGTDLLSRIPATNQHVIPPMGAGDRILAALAQLWIAASESGHAVNAVEKIALYYIATRPEFANPRQLREAVVRAVERVPASDDRMRYDHLFSPGDPTNKSFWLEAQPVAAELAGRYVQVEE